jgi:hypothetical protein
MRQIQTSQTTAVGDPSLPRVTWFHAEMTITERMFEEALTVPDYTVQLAYEKLEQAAQHNVHDAGFQPLHRVHRRWEKGGGPRDQVFAVDILGVEEMT